MYQFKKINYRLIASILLFVSLFIGEKVMADQLNFNVTPIMPDSQVAKNTSYFDINLHSDSTESLEVILENTTDKAIKVRTTFNRATTNFNGIVEYGEGKFKEDASLQYNVEELVTIDQPEVTLSPGEKKNVTILVEIPPEEIVGTLAGGLTFKEVTEKTSQKQESAIRNEYAYLVALLIKGEKVEELTSELTLNEVAVSQINSERVILANLQNLQPKFEPKMFIQSRVTKKGENTILFKRHTNEMQMAPNSNFEFSIPLEGERLSAGSYMLYMDVETKFGKWQLEKEFTVASNEARVATKKTALALSNQPLFTIILSVVGLIFLLLYFQFVKKVKSMSD